MMKVIAERFWKEPSVAIGLLTTIAMAVLALLDGTDWDVQTIVGVLAPVTASLGIRQLVTPAKGDVDTTEKVPV